MGKIIHVLPKQPERKLTGMEIIDRNLKPALLPYYLALKRNSPERRALYILQKTLE